MSDKKISALTAISVIADNDVLPIVDVSATETKKATVTQIKELAPVQSVASKTGAVTLEKSDVGLGNVDNTADTDKPISTATQTALNAKEATITATTTADYYRGDKTFATLNKSAVGLSNVDNTSDANKPVSTATQTALDAKIAKSDGATYDVNALAAVTQAEYDALTPSATTLYFII